jgi:hypothetical protein
MSAQGLGYAMLAAAMPFPDRSGVVRPRAVVPLRYAAASLCYIELPLPDPIQQVAVGRAGRAIGTAYPARPPFPRGAAKPPQSGGCTSTERVTVTNASGS